MSIPDNYDMWLFHEADLDKRLERLPKCRRCGNPIQDEHYFNVFGIIHCEDCMNDKFRRDIDDYYV